MTEPPNDTPPTDTALAPQHQRIFRAHQTGTTRYLSFKEGTFFRAFPAPDPNGYLPAEFKTKADVERAIPLAWPKDLAWDIEEACARACPVCAEGR